MGAGEIWTTNWDYGCKAFRTVSSLQEALRLCAVTISLVWNITATSRLRTPRSHCPLCLVQLLPPLYTWLTPFSPSGSCSDVAFLVGPFQTTIFKTEMLSLIVSSNHWPTAPTPIHFSPFHELFSCSNNQNNNLISSGFCPSSITKWGQVSLLFSALLPTPTTEHNRE